MPERHALICTCGFTTFASRNDFGTSVACSNCGAELEVDESLAAPEAAPEAGHDQTLPEPPEEPTRQARARSPFEDEDVEEQEPTRNYPSELSRKRCVCQ